MKKVVGLLVIFASGLIKLHAQHVQVGILADLFSAGISAEYHLDDRYALGVESSVGYSTKATLSTAGYLGMLENPRTRAYISKKTRRNENIWGKTPDLDSGAVVLSLLHPVKWIWDPRAPLTSIPLRKGDIFMIRKRFLKRFECFSVYAFVNVDHHGTASI